jgi:uncharacterized protein YjiS (DUF1127 family)
MASAVYAGESRMPTLASRSLMSPASGMFGMRLLAGIGQYVRAAVRAWRISMRQRRELPMLNDVELRELSLTATDIYREAGKPFWKSVQLTCR